MRSYEIVLIIKPAAEEARKKVIAFATNLLKGLKVKEEDLGSKALAYKIKGELSGHYYTLSVEAETIPADFEKKLLESNEILRHLVLKK